MVLLKYNCRRSLIITGLAVFSLVFVFGCSRVGVKSCYENGALATSAPIATDVGVEVFKRGGNSFDVAVAVGFTLAVVDPKAGNIGGGGFAVIRDGKNGDIKALDFRETAPENAFEKMYLDDSDQVIPDLSNIGVKASGVPATVAGLYELWRKYGSLEWEELVNIAASLADTGFVVDNYLAASLFEYKDELNLFEETADIFCPGGRCFVMGNRLVQADLAKTLYRVAAEGPDGFYKGEVADKILKCMEKHGGLIGGEDLAGYRPVWREAVSCTFDGYDIYSMSPPSSGGILIAQILKILEPFDFSRYFHDSPEYIHLFCEASKFAFADRSVHMGDPEFYNVPKTLLDSSYLAGRRELIDIKHATHSADIGPGNPPLEESNQTTHFSICDKNGNMVAITYTLNSSYGSKLVVAGAGFLLNNEMDDFSIKAGHPNLYGLIGSEANRIEPGKRMLSSMSPTLVLKDGKPSLIVGAPGGSKIITTVAQALINFIRFDRNADELCQKPRFHHQWMPDILYLEEGGFDINTIQALIRLGHNVEESSPYSDLQVIHIDEANLMTPASDPRHRGKASGY